MTEYKFVTFNTPLDRFLDHGRMPGLTTTRLAWDDFEEDFEKSMEGWEPVSFQVLNTENAAHVVVMFKLDVNVPDATDALDP